MTTPRNDSDLERYLNKKNVRNARNDFQSSHSSQFRSPDNNNTNNQEGIMPNNESNSSSNTSAEDSALEDETTNNNNATVEPVVVPAGYSRLDTPDPAVQQLYEEGLDNMVEPLLPDSTVESDGTESGTCCARMRRYKGVWFLLLTLVVLLGITIGVVLGAKGDNDDDDDENDDGVPPAYNPTVAPFLPSIAPSLFNYTLSPSSTRNHTRTLNYYCGVSPAFADCDSPCPSGLDSECAEEQQCLWFDQQPCSSTQSSSSGTDAPVIPDAYFCGKSYADAVRKCISCSAGTSSECPWFHQCYANVFPCIVNETTTIAPTSSSISTTTPTVFPTMFHTAFPTMDPTTYPTFSPTSDPTSFPTSSPTIAPTMSPTTTQPTLYPTIIQTGSPTVTNQPQFPLAFCGSNYADAASCSIPCPNGLNSECPNSHSHCYKFVSTCSNSTILYAYS